MNRKQIDSPEEGRTLRIIMKVGVLMCLGAIVFGLIVMVAGAMFNDGETDASVPVVFVWMGAGSCGLFTLGALVGLGAWFVSVAADD